MAKEHAKFGAAAYKKETDKLPGVFPREMGPKTMEYLREIVESGLTSNIISRFEAELARMHGRRFCIGAPGCTQALFATMLGMDFEPGDEIIASPIGDYGCTAGMHFCNYVPVFADAEPGTALISARTIEPLITDRTRAILCVHMLGLPCDMDPIIALARRHNLVIIEDVCQAILSTYKGRLAGTMGDVACFSFDSEKTCPGDVGGATITDDEALRERIYNRAIARGAYMEPGFGRVHSFQGFATRMPLCSAATVLANLELLPDHVARRRRTATMLDDLLREIPGIIPYEVPADRTHHYWMYGFSIDPAQFRCSADEFAAQVDSEGIAGAGVARYYLLPASISFLRENVESGRYPFCCPPSSRTWDYTADSCPNARDFLETWIRWTWTEKYEERHVGIMRDIIGRVAERNRA
ncbi:MAG TPA: DegT/DnrJ/EryC1/StrS family aminotransferase [Candidatus Brocadiia bacterium]|nr:DegT/DnrJ/EryC1/StrS family aminotransferase [Candidatus Brocadiia bacterium]